MDGDAHLLLRLLLLLLLDTSTGELHPAACKRATQHDSTSGPSSLAASVCFDLVDDLSALWNGSCSYGPRAAAQRHCHEHHEHHEHIEHAHGQEHMLCGGHGACFFGRCYCQPGFEGAFCKTRSQSPQPPCTPFSRRHRGYHGQQDACLRHPAYGTSMVPKARWLEAQAAEAAIHRTAMKLSLGEVNRIYTEYWRSNFPTLEALLPHGSDLGRVIEVGCGPYTWSYGLLLLRPDLGASVISLLDPGMRGYLRSGIATFANGTLHGRFPVELLPTGAELLPPCYSAQYDTLMLFNVLEHTWNAFATLHHAHRLLKPGGLLLFGERIIYQSASSQIYHPVRLTTKFFDDFFAGHFDEVYRLRGAALAEKVSQNNKPYHESDVVFAGRKRARGPTLAVHQQGPGGGGASKAPT
jgi:SAM-dependent methyltransferase